jgi:hypothetical protein
VVQSDRLEQARAECLDFKNKWQVTELNHQNTRNDYQNAKNKIQQLQNELRSQEPTWYQRAGKWVADKTGFTAARNLISNLATVGLIIGIIWVFSFLYKWVIKRLFKSFLANFKSEPKPKPETPETKIVEIVREKEPIRIIEPAKINKAQPQPTIESKPAVEVVKAEPKTDKVETTIEPTGQEAEVKPKRKTDETKSTENLDQPRKIKQAKKTKNKK